MSTLAAPVRTWAVIPAAATIAPEATVMATNRNVLVALAAQMTTRGLWVVDYSCNSVTAGVKGDGVNRWASGSDVIGNTPGNAHSWIVGTLQGGLGQLCLDRDNTLDGSGKAYWSEAAGFTGGTTLLRPTATDEVEITNPGGNLLHTVNGTNVIHMWRCTETGRQVVMVIITNSGATAGPCHVMVVAKAASTPVAWTTKIAARVMSGSGVFGNRSDWATTGLRARVSGTLRTPVAVGDTAPTSADVDGDALLVPCGLNDASVGRLGFLDDFHFAADQVAKYATYSDVGGAMGWARFDELVVPWDHTTAHGVNTAGAKLLVNYLPAADEVDPVITWVTPAAPGVLGGTHDQAADSEIVFQVTDVDPGVETVTVTFLSTSPAGQREEVVYRRDAFRRGWSGSVTAITDGYEIRVQRPAGGWPEAFRIGVDVFDRAGNLV